MTPEQRREAAIKAMRGFKIVTDPDMPKDAFMVLDAEGLPQGFGIIDYPEDRQP